MSENERICYSAMKNKQFFSEKYSFRNTFVQCPLSLIGVRGLGTSKSEFKSSLTATIFCDGESWEPEKLERAACAFVSLQRHSQSSGQTQKPWERKHPHWLNSVALCAPSGLLQLCIGSATVLLQVIFSDGRNRACCWPDVGETL